MPSLFLGAREDLDQLGDHLQLPLVSTGEDYRLEVGIDRFQDDPVWRQESPALAFLLSYRLTV